MGKKIIWLGVILILFVTVINFRTNDIVYLITKTTVNQKTTNTTENEYYLEDHFNYVSNYPNAMLNTKNDIIDSIYYTINSGNRNLERYCNKDYIACKDDLEDIVKDKDLVSKLNYFVHPYNTINSISFYSRGNYHLYISTEPVYSKEEMQAINKVVDKVINDEITNSMSTREKIKAVHDYIIDNATYDTLKKENINDSTYKSETAYGVLIQGYGICSGYADAVSIFLNKLNIINYRIGNDSHVWNLVFIDGKWLHLDATWDDPISDENINRDNYFLIDSKTLTSLADGTHNYDKKLYIEAQ